MSKDGRQVLTGSADNTLILWDARTSTKLRIFEGHTGTVASAAIGWGGHLLTASMDGTARLWDLKTGKELCRLISIDAGKEWLAVSPEGLFDGSLDAPKLLAYRLAGSLEFVPLERYQHKFFQPGLLTLIMKGKCPTPKADITKSLPPKVRITSPARSSIEVRDGTLHIEASAETRGDHPVKTFRLLLDGRPYGGQRGIYRVDEPRLGTSTAQWTVALEPGKHTLKVLVDTEYVQGASEEIEVRYVGGAPKNTIELPTLYVLAIGISKYPATRKLDYAAQDADALAQACQRYSNSLFNNIEVKVLADDQASRQGIFEGLQWFREHMGQKSVGILFFAGHGEKDRDGSLYLLPVDFEEKNLAGSAIDADVLKKQLAGISGRLILMLDACHAGEIDSGKKRGVGALTDQLVRDLTAEENGLIVMCSALGNEEAQESHQFRHGLFTEALLEGLQGKASKTKDGAVYLTALDAYVAARVKELSKDQQNPVTGKPTSVRDFPVSKP